TVLYLVTRGRGITQSLLPAHHRFDPATHLPQPEASVEDPKDGKEAPHAQ
ncbi:TIGR03749 family integrating conjugative element protein, partial [Xanthomonas campestris pv. raphani]|nr:TIGR03749 family integrating conjugative element protein [Xanthomonas campestris pv. raphani]